MVCKSRRRTIPAPGRKLRAAGAWLALVAALAAWAQVGLAEPLVLEDFESLPADSTARVVREGKAVTHGKQAVMLRADESVVVDMTPLDANTVAWLKIDSMTTQPFVQPLEMSFRSEAGSTVVRLVANVQPGSDTVWLPISAFLWRFGGEWPGPLKSMVLKNTGPEAISIDYVRAEPAAPAPESSVLIDYGPSRQVCWPGFRRGDEKDSHIVWPNTYTARGASRDFPDELTGDFVGPRDVGSTYKISIPAPWPSGAYVWAWLTHDFHANFPPTEYALQVAGKNVLQKRISSTRFFGPEGLLRGKGGKWTANWYAKDFANQLCDQVGFQLHGGPNAARLLNCQFAAMAMAPAARQRELREYVSMVNRDLERFRRQFVVATRRDTLCAIQPTPEQTKNGMMVFDPNSDQPFDAAWTPADANEVRQVTCSAVPGQMSLIALAVVPTRPLAYLSPGVQGFSGSSGSLRLAPQGSDAWIAERVPNAYEGTVRFVPWLLQRRATGLGKDEVVHVAAGVWVADNAMPGVYKGNVLLRSNVGTVRVPVEIRVVGAKPLDRTPTYAPTYFQSPTHLYGGLGEALSTSRASRLRRNFYSQLLPGGINAFWMVGPDYRSGKLSDTEMAEYVREMPPRSLSGRPIFSLYYARYHLKNSGIGPSTKQYAAFMKSAIEGCRLAARRLGAPEPLWYIARSYDAQSIKDQNAEAGVLASLGAKLVLRAKTSVLKGLSADDRRGCFANYAALLTTDDDATAELIRQFKAIGNDRIALLDVSYPERYAMGFRPAVLGADGALTDSVMPLGPVYDGMDRVGKGLVTAESEKVLTPTVGLLLLREGVDDLTLWKQCAREIAEADHGGFPGPEAATLREAMAGIQKQVLATRVYSSHNRITDTHISSREMDQWRQSLIEKLGALTAARARK